MGFLRVCIRRLGCTPPLTVTPSLIFAAIYYTLATWRAFRRDKNVVPTRFCCYLQYFWALGWSMCPQSPLGPRCAQMTPKWLSKWPPKWPSRTPKWILCYEIYTTKYTARNLHHEIYTTTFTLRNLHHKINTTKQLQIHTTKFTPHNLHRNLHHEICTRFTPRRLQHEIYTTRVTPRHLHHNICTTKFTPQN